MLLWCCSGGTVTCCTGSGTFVHWSPFVIFLIQVFLYIIERAIGYECSAPHWRLKVTETKEKRPVDVIYRCVLQCEPQSCVNHLACEWLHGGQNCKVSQTMWQMVWLAMPTFANDSRRRDLEEAVDDLKRCIFRFRFCFCFCFCFFFEKRSWKEQSMYLRRHLDFFSVGEKI